MPDTPRHYFWPMADERTLYLAILFLVGVFAAAVLLELYRRRKDRRLRITAEWRAVRELCRDRELPEEDCTLLRAIIARFAGDTPYKAATKRLLFNECVAGYVNVLRATDTAESVARHGRQLREIRNALGLEYVPLGQRIYSTRELYAGQALWVAETAGHNPHWFHFTVTAIDEAYFTIGPVGTGDAPGFGAGDRLKVRLWREEDARYLFEAEVERIETRPAVWVMRHVETVVRNQARAHYRVRTDSTADVTILSAPLNGDYTALDTRPAVTTVRGRITSLSGGGIALVFQQPVPKQVLLKLPVALPDFPDRLTVYVAPVGSQLLPGGRSLVRGRFVAMDEPAREAITRYIFMKQKQNASDEM